MTSNELYNAQKAAEAAWDDYNSFIESNPDKVNWDEANALKATATEADELAALLLIQENCHHTFYPNSRGGMHYNHHYWVDDLEEWEECPSCGKVRK